VLQQKNLNLNFKVLQPNFKSFLNSLMSVLINKKKKFRKSIKIKPLVLLQLKLFFSRPLNQNFKQLKSRQTFLRVINS
jgi:hypothetical protein